MQIKKIFSIFCILVMLGFSFSTYSYALTPYIWSDSSKLLETTSSSNTTDLKLESGGAVLIEQTTGQVLYEHNAHEMFRPASVTKVMSLLLIMEALDNRSNIPKRSCSMFSTCCFYGWFSNLA